jgi:hypothetical protein
MCTVLQAVKTELRLGLKGIIHSRENRQRQQSVVENFPYLRYATRGWRINIATRPDSQTEHEQTKPVISLIGLLFWFRINV